VKCVSAPQLTGGARQNAARLAKTAWHESGAVTGGAGLAGLLRIFAASPAIITILAPLPVALGAHQFTAPIALDAGYQFAAVAGGTDFRCGKEGRFLRQKDLGVVQAESLAVVRFYFFDNFCDPVAAFAKLFLIGVNGVFQFDETADPRPVFSVNAVWVGNGLGCAPGRCQHQAAQG
jgi:hypothetical protein